MHLICFQTRLTLTPWQCVSEGIVIFFFFFFNLKALMMQVAHSAAEMRSGIMWGYW